MKTLTIYSFQSRCRSIKKQNPQLKAGLKKISSAPNGEENNKPEHAHTHDNSTDHAHSTCLRPATTHTLTLTRKEEKNEQDEPFKRFQSHGQGYRNELELFHAIHESTVMPSLNVIALMLSKIFYNLKRSQV